MLARPLPDAVGLGSQPPLTRPMAISETIRTFLQSAGSTIMTVEFIKKDGTIRKISFNPRDRNEIKGTGTAVKNPDIICVRDFNLARKNEPAWRSFNVNSIRRINCNRQTFDFTV
jgi:hypothetical protein